MCHGRRPDVLCSSPLRSLEKPISKHGSTQWPSRHCNAPCWRQVQMFTANGPRDATCVIHSHCWVYCHHRETIFREICLIRHAVRLFPISVSLRCCGCFVSSRYIMLLFPRTFGDNSLLYIFKDKHWPLMMLDSIVWSHLSTINVAHFVAKSHIVAVRK